MVDEQQEKGLLHEELPQGAGASAPSQTVSEANKSKEMTKEAGREAGEAKKSPGMSKGEKVFSWTAYTGLNYWVNLVSSVAIADFFVNGKGRKGLDNGINRTAKFLHKSGVTSLKKAHHNSKIGLETMVLTSGGLILLAPLKWMEDNKRPIVHWINKKLGIKQIAPDGHEQNPDEIHIEKEQPPQSWGNVIWRRVLSTAAVIGAGMGLDHFARNKNKILPPETYNLGDGLSVTYDAKVQGGKSRVENKVFSWIDRGSEMVRGKKFSEHGKVSRWTKLAILDSAFTVITAVVMRVTNGAKKAKMPAEIDESNDPPARFKYPNKIKFDAPVADKKFSFAERIVRRETMPIPDHEEKGGSTSFVDAIQKKDASPAVLGI